MTQSFDVASAKSKLSELLNRASYGNERFLIRKRGRPIAAIVSTDDLARLESGNASRPDGLLAVAERLREFGDYPEILDDIVRERQDRMDREVNLD
jgi:prevent-host-death family protein